MNKKLYDKHFSCVLNFEMLLTRHIVTLIFILITRNAQMTSCIGLKRSFAMLAKKGYRLKDNVFRAILVSSSTECGQFCLMEEQCKSLNYHHRTKNMEKSVCELNNSTKEENNEKFEEDAGITYFYTTPKVSLRKLNTAADISTTTTPSTTARPTQLPVFKSCLDVQTYNNSRSDGEYLLQISYPVCNKTVKLYCADMNTAAPLEYLSLKAGSEKNFAKRYYVGGPNANKNGSSKTQFSKIRLRSDLTVVCDDFRFAQITWYYYKEVYCAYASASDCHHYSCTTTKNGVFKMDLSGTGMKFVTPIDWAYGGYRGCSYTTPDQYSMSTNKQVVSGRCGGYCGGCWAKTLVVEPVGC